MSAAVLPPLPSLLEALHPVPDGRKPRGRRYSLPSLLTFAICAMLCGARSYFAIAQWGREHDADDIRTALGIVHSRTPSVATIFRLFRDLDVDAFEQALAAWVHAQGVPPDEVIAIDGKSIRGLHGEHVPGVHLVAAYAQHSAQVLAEKGGPIARAS